jgi:hypothetical protein
MPHFRTTIDPPGISVTAAAIGPDVFPTLRMARAALIDAVDKAIEADRIATAAQIDRLKIEFREHAGATRAARAMALKVREADLPSEPAPAADTTVRAA